MRMRHCKRVSFMVSAGGAAGVEPTEAPHFPQNSFPDGAGAPHRVQTRDPVTVRPFLDSWTHRQRTPHWLTQSAPDASRLPIPANRIVDD